MRRRFAIVLVSAALLGLGLVACRQQGTSEPAEPVINRVENAELGVAIADLPAVFRVARNEAAAFELELVEGTGRLQITAGEEESSVNLVAALKEHQEDILGRPGGEYKGSNELVIPSLPGAAYYSRGRFEDGEGVSEETVLLAIHPWKDRQLRVIYTYPAGDDSPARLQEQLFAVAGELEGLPAAGEENPEG